MRPKEFDIDVADANLTGFASNVTGAAFVLTTTATSDGLAHQVSIRNDTANSHAGKTVTLVGTDANDNALTEVVTGPAGSATVESVGYFKTLTSATPSATIGADTFDIGWVDEVASKVIPLNVYSSVGASVNVDVTGTIDYSVQQTFDPVYGIGVLASAQWVPVAVVLTAATTDQYGLTSVGATAVRVLVNSYSSGAELQVNVSQAYL